MKLLTELQEQINVIIEAKDPSKPKQYFVEGVMLQSEIKNRNSRVYPKAILTREVTRYNKEYIAEDRGIGELGHPDCFHGSTQILTVANGWKFIKDVVVDEQVYTLNPDSNEVEIHGVQNVYDKPYNGKMIEINGRTLSTKVTPNHRFLIQDRNGRNTFFTAQEIHDSIEELNHHCIPKNHSSSVRISPEKFRISDDLEVDFDTFVAFLGLYLSEGHVTHRKGRGNSYVVGISQNENEVADVIRSVLDKLRIVYHVIERKQNKNKSLVFITSNNDLANYLVQFGKAKNKYLDPNIIAQLDGRTAKIFLEHYILGDGRGDLNSTYNRCDVFSISEQMIQDVSHVAFIAGFATRVFTEEPKNSYIGERIILADNKSPLHFCRFSKSDGFYLDDRFIDVKEVPYNDNVYCVTVQNGTFYARDASGYSFWTGNSPTINLDRASHKFLSVKEDGNNFIGKAKILDTPMGKIVKSLMDENVKLGMSSRGMGSLKPVNEQGYQLVQDDYYLATMGDLVADPSAPDAFVRGIMEQKEWVWDNGLIKEMNIAVMHEEIVHAKRKQLEEVTIKNWQKFLDGLSVA